MIIKHGPLSKTAPAARNASFKSTRAHHLFTGGLDDGPNDPPVSTHAQPDAQLMMEAP
jgi:hypothetical protein